MRFCSHLFPEAVLSGPGRDRGSAADNVDGLRSFGAVKTRSFWLDVSKRVNMITGTSLNLLPQTGFGGLFGMYPSILEILQVAQGLFLLSTACSQLACVR